MEIRSKPQQVQLAISIGVFLVPFMGSSLNLAMPLVVEDFGMSAYSLTYIVSAYLGGTAMFQMPAARVADLLGRRRMLLVGLGLLAFFTLLSGFAWSGRALIAFRFVSGIASALVFATNMAILTAVFPKEKRGSALGINTAVVYAAAALGPFLGGLLSKHLGWRGIFFVCTGVAVLAIVATALAVKEEWTESKGEPFDYRGSFVYLIAIGGVVFGFSFLPGVSGWILFAIGLAAAAVFIMLEKRTKFPVFRLDLFRYNYNFRMASLSAMINYAASFAVGFTLSLYLQYVKGMPADAAGLLLVVQPATQTVFSPIAGRLSDRVNPSYLTTGGMLAITAGLLVLAFFTADTPLWLAGLTLAVIGFGFGMFSSPNVNIIMGSVSTRNAGLASATTGTARQIGQSFSMAIVALVVHAYLGDHPLVRETAHEFLPAMRTSFLLFVGLCLLGAYTSASKLMRGRAREEWRHISARLTARESDREGK